MTSTTDTSATGGPMSPPNTTPMKTWNVRVVVEKAGYATVEVDAESKDEARKKVSQYAPDIQYPPDSEVEWDQDYTVFAVNEVEPA